MANRDTVTRSVIEKLDQLIELENKRISLDNEIEAREGQIVNLNVSYRKAMLEINDVYKTIVDMYSLNEKTNYDSGKSPESATYSFGDIELLYTTYRIEDGKTIYKLTKDGVKFSGFSDEELLRTAAIHCSKKMAKVRAQIIGLEIDRSKKEYEIASLLAEMLITQPVKVMTKLSLKGKIKESKKSLAIIEAKILQAEAEMRNLVKNGEKKFLEEANEMQYLIKACLELKENREPIKDELEAANDKLNNLKKDFVICLDEQEKIIRDIISKSENIAALQHIINRSIPGSSYSDIAKVILKLAALDSKNKRK